MDSDYDFLVIKNIPLSERRQYRRDIYHALSGMGIAKDVLVATPDEIARNSPSKNREEDGKNREEVQASQTVSPGGGREETRKNREQRAVKSEGSTEGRKESGKKPGGGC